MQIGLIGLGKMGGGIARRLEKAGFEVIGYDPVAGGVSQVRVDSLKEMVDKLEMPRVVWLMVPSGEPVEKVIGELKELFGDGGLIIDGGNSRYTDSIRHAKELATKNIAFIDAGVSGGIAGEEVGYAIMAGGAVENIARVQEVFDALVAEKAFLHVGPVGSGHFVKMVHNAIEYGMMQAMAEGFDLIKNGPFEDLGADKIADMWNHGTIIRSFLMELAAEALQKDPDLKKLEAHVDDSGEGRWSVETAIENAVPFMVNTAAVYARFNSRKPNSDAMKLLAALRNEFGGHAVKKA